MGGGRGAARAGHCGWRLRPGRAVKRYGDGEMEDGACVVALLTKSRGVGLTRFRVSLTRTG